MMAHGQPRPGSDLENWSADPLPKPRHAQTRARSGAAQAIESEAGLAWSMARMAFAEHLDPRPAWIH
jgi:hypothetical protein